MLRNTKRKSLYEVIGRTGSKTGYEQLHSQGSDNAASAQQEPVTPPSVIRWVRKPRPVQFNAGRIEFSIPYQVAIAVLLGLILLIVVSFRLGQWFGVGSAAGVPASKQTQVTRPAEQSPKAADSTPAGFDAAKQSGRNRIVIQMYQVKEHLEPVREYFDRMGVETEILERNNWYYLVTKNKYNNIDKVGTDGYLARQKIVDLGAGYKAPPGFETFGTKPFSGAFGMKFEE
jgi:hypothetical protein